jgi:hypothetical protein
LKVVVTGAAGQVTKRGKQFFFFVTDGSAKYARVPVTSKFFIV